MAVLINASWSEAGTLGQRAWLVGTYFGYFSLYESLLDEIRLYTTRSHDYSHYTRDFLVVSWIRMYGGFHFSERNLQIRHHSRHFYAFSSV